MYKKLVIQFKPLKYIVTSRVFTSIFSFDGFQYICKTCDEKMLKGKFLCQAVSNKLKIFDFQKIWHLLKKWKGF